MRLLNKISETYIPWGRQNGLYIWLGVLPFFLAVLMLSQPLVAAQNKTTEQSPADKKKLDTLRQEIEDTSKRAHALDVEAQAVAEEISGLRQNLVAAARKIQASEILVSEQESRLQQLNQQQKSLEESLQQRQKQMSLTLAAMQRLSQQPAELVAFRPEKSINILRSASLLNILLPELKIKAERIGTDIAQLEQLRQDIEVERAEHRSLLATLNEEQATINILMGERRQKQKDLIASTAKERQKLKVFAAKAKNLEELIEQIEREAARREKAAREAALRTGDKPENKASKKAILTRGSFDGQSFASARGLMPLPVRGLIDRPFGRQIAEGLTSKGITISTRPRATVIAPHEGRVVFAGKFRTYGQLLIIDHGQEYHTLLAGMTRIDAIVGQWVLKGEPVGQMAAPDQSPKGDLDSVAYKLYVELRRRGKPINPLPWIVARDRKVHG